ncbi:MAG: hypothetical protein WAV30_00220 [Microgenomates group bacterium]
MAELMRAFNQTKFLEPLRMEKYHGKWQLVKRHVEMEGQHKIAETVVYGKGISVGEKLQYAYNMITLASLGVITGTTIGAGIAIINSLQ